PPDPAVRIVVDMIEFTAKHVPRFNPVSISGYHIREAGATAVQELAFTLADGLGYVEAACARGLDIDSFAPRLSFFFDIHNDFFDETWALPTEDAVTVALRTQQILAEESGVALTIDPLGGSYYLETLTDQMEAGALEYIRKIDAMGGIIRAIDSGYPQREIADAAYRYQLMDDRREKIVVGVNKYAMQEERPINYLKIDAAVEREQIERVGRFKAARDGSRVERRLKQLAEACREQRNVMPVLIDAVKDYVSLG